MPKVKIPRAAPVLPRLDGPIYMHIRHDLKLAYVSDMQKRDLSFWQEKWERERGIPSKLVLDWARRDQWPKLRVQYWADIEQSILDERKQQIVTQKTRELAELDDLRSHMGEWLRPLRDKRGRVRRHTNEPYQGLPMYPLEMPKMDAFLRAYVLLDKQIMLKRGEIVDPANLNAALNGESDDEVARQVAALPSNATNFTEDEMTSMARALVLTRQTGLADQPRRGLLIEGAALKAVIDAEGEAVESKLSSSDKKGPNRARRAGKPSGQ